MAEIKKISIPRQDIEYVYRRSQTGKSEGWKSYGHLGIPLITNEMNTHVGRYLDLIRCPQDIIPLVDAYNAMGLSIRYLNDYFAEQISNSHLVESEHFVYKSVRNPMTGDSIRIEVRKDMDCRGGIDVVDVNTYVGGVALKEASLRRIRENGSEDAMRDVNNFRLGDVFPVYTGIAQKALLENAVKSRREILDRMIESLEDFDEYTEHGQISVMTISQSANEHPEVRFSYIRALRLENDEFTTVRAYFFTHSRNQCDVDTLRVELGESDITDEVMRYAEEVEICRFNWPTAVLILDRFEDIESLYKGLQIPPDKEVKS